MEFCVKGVTKGGIIATCIPLIKWINMWWFTWTRCFVTL